MIPALAEALRNTNAATESRKDAVSRVQGAAAFFHAIFSGLVYALCFPKFNLGPVFAWIWPLFLLTAIEKSKNHKQAYLASFLFSFVAYGIILYWIPITIWTWSHNALVTIIGWIALVGYLSFITAFFGPLSKKFLPQTSQLTTRNFLAPLFAVPSLWVFIELIRSSAHTFLGGFPWCLAGHALTNQIYLAQIAEIGSVWILSFLVIFVATALWFLLKTKKLIFALVGSGALFAVFFFGLLRYHYLKNKLQESFKVAILQGNIYQYEKWDPQKAERILYSYSRLIREAYQKNPDLVVWPETAYPLIIPTDDPRKLTPENLQIPVSMNSYQLVGAVTMSEDKLFNSALLFKGNELQGVYSKVHLVPFGEYVPWRGLFARWVRVLNELGDIFPGNSLVPLEGPLKLGVNICYESIFPEITLKEYQSGAQALVNVTNDGWYLDTAAPYQHFLFNRLRAIENRLPLIRAANTGISAIISPLGHVVQKTKLNEEKLLTDTIQVLPQNRWAILSYTQKLFPFLCVVAFLAASLLKWLSPKKEKAL